MQENNMIDYTHFEQVHIHVGQIIEAKLNEKARVPAYILAIDFGDLGVKASSAQLTQNYTIDNLIGRKVCAVTNFHPKRVAGIKSEVLVLASMNEHTGTLLLNPDPKSVNGSLVF